MGERDRFRLQLGKYRLFLGKRTRIMGILNVTPDSFSDGGSFLDKERAVAQGRRLAEEGADIIDVGGESTRPGARAVSAREELGRVVPVIAELAGGSIPISIDTYKEEVAREALAAGAVLVNDVTSLGGSKGMAALVADTGAGLILMHMQGRPRDMQKNPRYNDPVGDIVAFLQSSIKEAGRAGVRREKIVVDPGLGFGKRLWHNLEILRRLDEFRVLGRPVLVGPSRKSMIGQVLGLPVGERLEGTAAAVAASILGGAHMVRVHDVREMTRVVWMTDSIAAGERVA